MFERISSETQNKISQHGLETYVQNIRIYKAKCIVAEFIYKKVLFKFDIEPAQEGAVNVDFIPKRSMGIKDVFRSKKKVRINSNVSLDDGAESICQIVREIILNVDKFTEEKAETGDLTTTPQVELTPTPQVELQGMNVGVLTLPQNKNYGGNLQAFAMMTALKKLTCNPVLINRRHPVEATDDTPKPEMKPAEADLYPKSYSLHRPTPNLHFINNHLKPFTRVFMSSDDLKAGLDDYGIKSVVIGSDQVWRANYIKTILPDYFGAFLADRPDITCISYAASFGSSNLGYGAALESKVSGFFKRFDAVSVREDSAVDVCKETFNVDARHNIDPTMLLEVDDYLKVFANGSREHQKDVLLTYILDNNDEKTGMVDAICASKKLDAVFPNGTQFKKGDALNVRAGDRTVEQWLASFYTASFVVTDSFHGVVFSLLFNKPFLAIGNRSRGLDRFTSLLKMFGLEERLVLEPTEFKLSLSEAVIDWDAVNAKIASLRSEGYDFLKTSLTQSRDNAVVQAAAVSAAPVVPVTTPVENAVETEPSLTDAYAANNPAWAISAKDNVVNLTVDPEHCKKGNTVSCKIPFVEDAGGRFEISIQWQVKTAKDTLDVFAKSGVTGKTRRVGRFTPTEGEIWRTDKLYLGRKAGEPWELVFGSVDFTGDAAGLAIKNVSAAKHENEDPVQAPASAKPSGAVENQSDDAQQGEMMDRAWSFARQDSDRYRMAFEQEGAVTASRARMMFSAHSLEKGLSRSDTRLGFGRSPLKKLAVEMNDWVEKDRDTNDEFFQASCSALKSYTEFHKKRDFDVSGLLKFFTPQVRALTENANNVDGGALEAGLVREPELTVNRSKPFLDVAFGRRSIREWTDQPVTDTDVDQAVSVALQAPSVCNRQAGRVHYFKNQGTIEQLIGLQGGFNGYKLPPALLLVTADLTAFVQAKERNQAFIDGGLFMMALLLGLEHLGLGSCPLNTALDAKRERQIRAISKIPDTEVCIAFVALGHYDRSVLVPRSKRYKNSRVLTIKS